MLSLSDLHTLNLLLIFIFAFFHSFIENNADRRLRFKIRKAEIASSFLNLFAGKHFNSILLSECIGETMKDILGQVKLDLHKGNESITLEN